MPRPFDAASKHMIDARPHEWLAAGCLPPGVSLDILNADLSAVSRAADKLIRVLCEKAYIAHIEFQTGYDRNLDRRVLVYNVLAGDRFDMEVLSEAQLPGVIEAMKRRLDSEVTVEEGKELWTATRLMMGLRWSSGFVDQLLRGVQGMQESSTYQEWFQVGVEKGRAAGARAFLLRRASKVLGEPDAAALRTLKAITDPRPLHELTDRVVDGHASSWAELPGAAA